MSGVTYIPNALNIMVDLETLSTQANGGIIAIGATTFFSGPFNPDFQRTFYQKASAKSVESAGFHIEKTTLQWWDRQDPEIRAEAFSGMLPIETLIQNFRTWVVETKEAFGDKPILLWGNGADFDCALLVDAFDHLFIPIPWTYRNHRCYRTLNGIYQHQTFRPYPGEVRKHCALDDALWQAHRAEQILARIYDEEEV